jgi:RNA polymerase sigma factor (TIGR02999 family)
MLEPVASRPETRAHVVRVLTDPALPPKLAAEELLPLVYEDLRQLARHRLAREPARGAKSVLQPTALVHESYLRLLGEEAGRELAWRSRAHFFGAAALAMRRILVEHSRRRRAEPGTGFDELPSTRELGTVRGRLIEIEDLDRALVALAKHDERKHDVVTLRFFAGRSVDDVAQLLDVSPRTVKRDFNFARAWLLEWLEEHVE